MRYKQLNGVNASSNTLDSLRNIAIGTEALRNITGNINNQNIAIGWRTSDALTAGENNVILGAQALGNQVAGSDKNVAIGASALGNINLGGGIDNSVAIGFEAGWNATIGPLVAIGAQAGRANGGGKNTYVGTESGKLNTANGNTFVGTLSGVASTTAGGVTIVGSSAGLNSIGSSAAISSSARFVAFVCATLGSYFPSLSIEENRGSFILYPGGN